MQSKKLRPLSPPRYPQTRMLLMRALCSALVALGVVACSSSAAPSSRLTVSLTGTATVQGYLTTVDGNSVYRCDITPDGDGQWRQLGRDRHLAGRPLSVHAFRQYHVVRRRGVVVQRGRTLVPDRHGGQRERLLCTSMQRPFQLHLVLYYSARVSRDSTGYDLACQ